MHIVSSDTVVPVTAAPSEPERPNALLKLLGLLERVELAAEREHYLLDTAHYLFPFEALTLSGPTPPHDQVGDPTQQDVKTDLQQQTILDFQASDTYLMRGWVRAGEATCFSGLYRADFDFARPATGYGWGQIPPVGGAPTRPSAFRTVRPAIAMRSSSGVIRATICARTRRQGPGRARRRALLPA
jgi:hypothetical protein